MLIAYDKDLVAAEDILNSKISSISILREQISESCAVGLGHLAIRKFLQGKGSHCNGVRIYIPQYYIHPHEILDFCNEDDFRELVFNYGGLYINVFVKRFFMNCTYRQIKTRYSQNPTRSNKDILLEEYQVSQEWLKRILQCLNQP